jgi:hypothetical protein
MTDLASAIDFLWTRNCQLRFLSLFATVLGTDPSHRPEALPNCRNSAEVERGDGPKIDMEGFGAVKHGEWEGSHGEEGCEDRYTADMAKVRSGGVRCPRTGKSSYSVPLPIVASRVPWSEARDPQYGSDANPSRIPEDDPDHLKELDRGKLQPTAAAHSDGSQFSARARAISMLGLSEEEAKGQRIAIINIWRPLKGPVMDSPLALCDARTVLEEHLTITTDVYGQGPFVGFLVSCSSCRRCSTRSSSSMTRASRATQVVLSHARCDPFRGALAPLFRQCEE